MMFFLARRNGLGSFRNSLLLRIAEISPGILVFLFFHCRSVAYPDPEPDPKHTELSKPVLLILTYLLSESGFAFEKIGSGFWFYLEIILGSWNYRLSKKSNIFCLFRENLVIFVAFKGIGCRMWHSEFYHWFALLWMADFMVRYRYIPAVLHFLGIKFFPAALFLALSKALLTFSILPFEFRFLNNKF